MLHLINWILNKSILYVRLSLYWDRKITIFILLSLIRSISFRLNLTCILSIHHHFTSCYVKPWYIYVWVNNRLRQSYLPILSLYLRMSRKRIPWKQAKLGLSISNRCHLHCSGKELNFTEASTMRALLKGKHLWSKNIEVFCFHFSARVYIYTRSIYIHLVDT